MGAARRSAGLFYNTGGGAEARERCLINISIDHDLYGTKPIVSAPSLQLSVAEHPALSVPPSLFVMNHTGHAKPFAIPTLRAELYSQSIEVGIISETWFKAHHQSSLFDIEGYVTYRKDRKKAKVWRCGYISH